MQPDHSNDGVQQVGHWEVSSPDSSYLCQNFINFYLVMPGTIESKLGGITFLTD